MSGKSQDGGATSGKSASSKHPARRSKAQASGDRLTLPAFGFADEILAGRQSDGTAAGEVASERLPAVLPAADDPGRIYEFADALAAENASREAQQPARVERIETWLTLGLGGEMYGLPVEPVREVLRVANVTRVPHAPSPIRGVAQVRGRVIPVIDLGLRLGLDAREIARASRILVIESRGRRLGLLVDRVFQVLHLDLEQAQEPPKDVVTRQSDFIFAVYHFEEQLILLLDVDRVLIVQPVSGAA